MSDRLDALDYYTLLGVTVDVDEPTLRAAFRSFARRYHPDRFSRADPHQRAQATEIYRRGSEAFQVLLDPDARRLYDVALGQGILRLTADQRDGAARALRDRSTSRTEAPTFSSPQARALYERAAAAIGKQDPRSAWKLLKEAQALEPDNAMIKQALQQTERRLRGL